MKKLFGKAPTEKSAIDTELKCATWFFCFAVAWLFFGVALGKGWI